MFLKCCYLNLIKRNDELFISITYYLFRKPKPIIKNNNQPAKTISNDPLGDGYVARAQEEQRLRRLKVCSHDIQQ